MRITLCLLVYLGLCSSIIGQAGRYLSPVFPLPTEPPKSIIYGNNATVMDFRVQGEAIEENLLLDLYQPSGDDAQERPLVIIMHSGSYLPVSINRNVYGSPRDSFNVALAQKLASCGYVTASISYRLGWDPYAQDKSTRTIGLIQAVYRGIQDTRTAIRFFKKSYAEENNPYRIDTSRIVVWGVGSGGYNALGAAYLDRYTEFLNTQFPKDKFLLDLNGDGQLDTPMIIEAIHGDLEGKKAGYAPLNGFRPFPPDDQLSVPNHPNYSSQFQLAVVMSGAIGDLSWVEAHEVPLIGFHAPRDPITPYGDGIAKVWTNGNEIIRVQGLRSIMEKIDSLGNNQLFKELSNDVYTQEARKASLQTGHPYYEGLYPLRLTKNKNQTYAREPWQWWDEDFWSQRPFDDTLNFHEAALIHHPEASATLGYQYIDTVLGYFLPRAYIALQLDEKQVTHTKSLDLNPPKIKLYPNPANDQLHVEKHDFTGMIIIQCYDGLGRVVHQQTTNELVTIIPCHHWASGLYWIAAIGAGQNEQAILPVIIKP